MVTASAVGLLITVAIVIIIIALVLAVIRRI
jgi:hypothetical protein